MNLVLANVDYRTHTTNEGNELQEGLAVSGWTLAGADFGNGSTDVPSLLDCHKPRVVFVQDKRDWDASNAGCFNHRVHFHRLKHLADCPDIFKVAVVKDAGSMIVYHKHFCEEIKANAVVTYYHDQSVLPLSPWLKDYRRIRTYHSVDSMGVLSSMSLTGPRRKVVVTGAVSSVYPLRQEIFARATSFGCDTIPHPGYSNAKSYTPDYLRKLSGYRVHIATASAYGFALRKIIESVAVGATPVTNLPAYDVLPEIDGALIRVAPNATAQDVVEAVERANQTWSLEERLHYARAAQTWYEWRHMGLRLSNLIVGASNNV